MSVAAAAITGGVALANAIGGAIAKRRAKKKGDKEAKKIQAEKAVQGKELQKGYDAQALAEKDLQRELEGQAVISPETQYARNASERATASAIDKATRTGSSTSEIMNMVSGLTSKGQLAGQRISASESERKNRARVASKTAGIKAAATGLAGKQAQIDLKNQARGQELQSRGLISQSTGEMFNLISGAVGDIGAAYLYSQNGGGNNKFNPYIGSGPTYNG